jgi:hypothetical protein
MDASYQRRCLARRAAGRRRLRSKRTQRGFEGETPVAAIAEPVVTVRLQMIKKI